MSDHGYGDIVDTGDAVGFVGTGNEYFVNRDGRTWKDLQWERHIRGRVLRTPRGLELIQEVYQDGGEGWNCKKP